MSEPIDMESVLAGRGPGGQPSDAAPPAYASSATPAEIADFLRGAARAVVTTHAKPDGDAVGSSLAIARALQRTGSAVEVWYSGPYLAWTSRMTGDTPVRRLGPDAPPTASVEPDAIVVTDTGAWQQLEHARSFVEPRAERTVIIDHHLHGHPGVAARRLIRPSAAAATEVAVDVIDLLLGTSPGGPAGGRLPLEIAEPLYLGLATDTGWFRFSNVTSATMRLAARLLDCGVDAAGLHEMVEQTDAPSRPRLLGRALSSLEFLQDGRVAMVALTQDDFARCGAQSEDTGGFTEPLMSVVGVQVAVVLTEMTKPGDPKPLTKVSLRSKPGPEAVNVAAVAASLGGGGHARAAGVRVQAPLGEARAAVLRALGV